MEQRLFTGYWGDGLTDLLMGCALVTGGLGWSWLGPLAVVHMPLWVTLWGPLRHRLVEPHAGYVKFSRERNRVNTEKLWKALLLGLGMCVLLILAFWLGSRSGGAVTGPEHWVAGLPAAILALMAVVTWLLTGARRFQLYSGGLLASGYAVVAAGGEPGLSLVLGSAFPLVGGGLLWNRFQRGYRAFETSGAN